VPSVAHLGQPRPRGPPAVPSVLGSAASCGFTNGLLQHSCSHCPGLQGVTWLAVRGVPAPAISSSISSRRSAVSKAYGLAHPWPTLQEEAQRPSIMARHTSSTATLLLWRSILPGAATFTARRSLQAMQQYQASMRWLLEQPVATQQNDQPATASQ